jgi:hypothetical protein
MSILANKTKTVFAKQVMVNEDFLTVELTDGRNVAVPLAWFPKLLNATIAQRNNWRLIGNGIGINWAELDEDISVNALL